MPILEILEYPDPRLRTKAAPVTIFDDALRKQVDDMFETMYKSNGIGLAATQVNYHHRVLTMDISQENNQPICLVNPEITHKEGKQYESEGCLSVVEAFDKIERAMIVKVKAFDVHGKAVELQAEGLLAACIQHELDHLNGILFIDHLSKLKQNRIREKTEKNKRRGYA